MGVMFDDRVEKAIDILWLKQDKEQSDSALRMLKEAANEGNGDACFFLARCYFGPSYVYSKFGFPEDDTRGYRYIEKSMELGSAVGMFGARRVGGFEPARGTYIYPPYTTDKQIWDEVSSKIQTGTGPSQIILKYMVANAYYYGDVIELMEIPDSEINEQKIQSFMYEAARIYEECLRQGFGFGIHNVIDIYESGEYVPENPKKALEIKKLGADIGIAACETMLGEEYIDTDLDLAEEYFRRGAEHGDARAYSLIARLYTYNGKRPQNLAKSLECLKAGLALEPDHPGLNNRYGEICFYGGDGIPVDYYKAVECFEKAMEENNWAADMLGTCYLKGLGTYVDYEKARDLFMIYEGDELCRIGLGEIYCFGLGVPQDIKKGMEYLDKVPNHPRTIEIKSHFKKGLLGGWKQIKER